MAVAAPLYVADKSALARLHHHTAAAVLVPLISSGLVATCGVVELELLSSARGVRDFLAQRQELRGYPRLDLAQVDFDRATDVMEELAPRGQHRAAGLPDLLLAAVTERHGLTLLHYDADFDLIAAVTRQPMRWVVERGTIP